MYPVAEVTTETSCVLLRAVGSILDDYSPKNVATR
jgi:hypothetical protein